MQIILLKKILMAFVFAYLLCACSVVKSTIKFNNIEFVDLGLPSGTLWGTKNIGAFKSSDLGIRVAWGEIASKDSFSWENYAFYRYYGEVDDDIRPTKYCLKNITDLSHNTKFDEYDGKIILDDCDDFASVTNKRMQMPTKEQCLELKTYCMMQKTVVDGVVGAIFTGVNGNTIFFPYHVEGDTEAGMYWTSSLCTEECYHSLSAFEFGMGKICMCKEQTRFCGRYVRPVLRRRKGKVK